MESFFVPLLKSSMLLLLFLLSYYVFLRRETFFISNRFFLVVGLIASFAMPFITITKTVYIERAPLIHSGTVELNSLGTVVEPEPSLNWPFAILAIYLLGILIFSIRLIFQLLAIRKIKKRGLVSQEDGYYHVKTHKWISPFSFFKYIFYFPQQFTRQELNTIINHEKVHVRQYHSLDILFIEIVHILQWFNPTIWFYKAALKQNLEFIADSQACGSDERKKEYQYLMLKQATANHNISIVNPFFNSIIKKRIVMLNQRKSKRIHLLKFLPILPLLGLFLMGFNTKEVIKFNDTLPITSLSEPAPLEFISPLKPQDIKKISSGFGPAMSPFTHTMDFHNGIDLIASKGKNVMASADGKVEVSSSSNKNGNYIVIKHQDAYSTKYLHLEDRAVKTGDKVQKGQLIGHVGNTGKSTGPHLHFEVLQYKKPINPESIIPFKIDPSSTSSPRKKKETRSDTKKRFELVIQKETTDKELKGMKAKLAESGVDFSYMVVHNEAGEIIDISLKLNGKSQNGESFANSFNSSNNEGISPLVIFIDLAHNTVSIGSKGTYTSNTSKITGGMGKGRVKSKNHNSKEVIVKKAKGVNTIHINGEEVEEDELSQHGVKISINNDSKREENIMLMRDSDNDNDIEVISQGEGFFYVDTDDVKNPLYVIDGKQSTKKAVRELSPGDIDTINVLKGNAAEKKYGEAAKDGVIEITTKN